MSRSIFSWLFFILVIVAAVGFYRGWFTVSTHNDDTRSHKVDVNLSVDPEKIKEDAKALKTKTSEITGGGMGKTPVSSEPKNAGPVKSADR